MADLYTNYAGVRSTILDQDLQLPPRPLNPNAILLIGTATKGPLYEPVRIDESALTNVFGSVPNDPFAGTSLVKGYKEIRAASAGPIDVVGVRIGNAVAASLDLYEHTLFTSGVMAYTPDTSSDFGSAITLQSLTDGPEGNGTEVKISDDGNGAPSLMEVTLPNGTTASFNLDISGTTATNVYSRCSDLVNAINADDDVSQYIKATVTLKETTQNILILSGAGAAGIETEYDLSLSGETWGDKVVDIVRAYKETDTTDSDSVEAGDISAQLAYTPEKDEDPNTKTITKFWNSVVNEAVLESATATQAGGSTITLDCATDSYWDAGETDSILDITVRKVTSYGTTVEFTEGVDYTVSLSTGVATLTTPIAIVDSYYADYKYLTTFVEANVRSQLVSGDRHSYFVTGDQIIFGAAQRYALVLQYKSKEQYSVGGDITVTADSQNHAIVTFINPASYPSVDDVVAVELIYEPELPAPTGTTLANGSVQQSLLWGGDDGRKMTTAQLYSAINKSFVAADNTPCRYVVIQGIHLDDTMEGYNAETGLPETVNAGYASLFSTFLRRKSQYVSECEGFIGVRPLQAATTNVPTLEEKEAWYDKLVNISATDTTRSANIMSPLDDYRLVTVVGDLIMLTQDVFGGATYIGYSPNTYIGMRWAHDNLSSMVNKRVRASNVVDLVWAITATDRVNAVNTARYTLFSRNSRLEGTPIIVADAPSCARVNSKFRRQYNVALVIEAVNAVRTALEPFIGQPNTNAVRQAMESSARRVLNEMTPNKLQGYQVSVSTTYGDAVNGKTRVDLTLQTAVEIQVITIQTRLQLSFA